MLTGRRSRGAEPFAHALALDGWSARSVWGYDAELECYWAELWRADTDRGPAVRIGVEHLVTTVDGLAGAMATAGRVPGTIAFLALTA
jgi:hypothetical protein